jgi:polar amino acid transport system permease protein
MEAISQQFLNFTIMREILPLLLRGLGTTLALCALVIPLGLAGGLLAALVTGAPRPWIRWPAVAFVDFFRAFPPLVLLILLYSGLPFAGIRLPAIAVVAIGFFLNASSYYGEIYRAGIESVGRGQWEAARSTGLGLFPAFAYVVMPQAVRNVLPDLISNTIEVIKLTSIASVVSFPELLYSADMARSLTFNSSPVVLAAIIYLAILWPLVRFVSRLEHRIVQH